MKTIKCIEITLCLVMPFVLLISVGCKGPSITDGCDGFGEIQWTFDKEKSGDLPEGWTVAETSGRGTTAIWEIVPDHSAPGKPHVVAVTESKNHGNTYNLLVANGTQYKDLEMAVALKAEGGKEDQGGGPIWRAMDADNYYICRWNPLEDNFRVYVVKDGKRKQLASANIDANSNVWHEIEIEHKGTKIVAEFDDKKLIELEDDTFKDAGMVGLWSKADATTKFDNIEVEVADG